MLWNVIYQFFVMYVFGGSYEGEYYSAFFGNVFYVDDGFGGTSELYTPDLFLKFGDFHIDGNADSINTVYLCFGNYLSLIATIITIVAILLFCVFIIKKIIGVMFRLFSFGA